MAAVSGELMSRKSSVKQRTLLSHPSDVPSPRNGRFVDLDEDKLRGGYYTSQDIAAWLCAWAIRSPKDQVLEPSCGDGVFLEAAAKRFIDLGVRKSAIATSLTGIEIIAAEATRARSRLSTFLGTRTHDVVKTSDFFSWWQRSKQPSFDVVVGNPPFIRYQTFPELHRNRAMSIMAEQGLSPNRLTNIWVPFVVATVASLRPGGRLALVLPAELLQVTYAAQLRSFLTDRFTRLDIVACNELFFEKAEQEVVLLLADGVLAEASETNRCRVTMTESCTVAEITNRQPAIVLANAQPKILRHDDEKWLKYFLTEREITYMRALRSADITANLSNHASVDVGVVTGKNEFFVLTSAQVSELGLGSYTAPLVSRSVQLKGAQVGKSDWKAMASAGDRVHLLHLAPINGTKLSGSLARYIRFGEGAKVNKGYKCSIREPWYAVPSVWTPDGFLFRQIYDFPRMVLNRAGATSTDTIHRLTCKGLKPERVIANTYTWLTAASAEIEGRSYGGGVLELEPTEAERLLMPAKLNGAMPLTECDRLTRAGRLDTVLEENARIVLMGHMGLSQRDCRQLRGIWMKMRDRRMARRRTIPANTTA
jgi:adenine-specific DNA-methyltransferase